jgi:hypothetical protein
MRLNFNAERVLRATNATAHFLSRLRRLVTDARATADAARDAATAVHAAVESVDPASESTTAPATPSSSDASPRVSPMESAAALQRLPANIRSEIRRQTGVVLERTS